MLQRMWGTDPHSFSLPHTHIDIDVFCLLQNLLFIVHLEKGLEIHCQVALVDLTIMIQMLNKESDIKKILWPWLRGADINNNLQLPGSCSFLKSQCNKFSHIFSFADWKEADLNVVLKSILRIANQLIS